MSKIGKLLIAQLELQQRLIRNVTESISDEHSSVQIKNANHASWLVGHLMSSRFDLAKLLGAFEQEPYPHLFGDRKGLEAGIDYPPITVLVEPLDSISNRIVEKIENLTEADLDQQSLIQLPISDTTLKGTLAFFIHHEAYTIGQVGILRRMLGYDSMNY